MNKIICGEAVEVLKSFDDNYFDIAVFSPPYDNLRDYEGYKFDMHLLGEALFRVIKEGGVVAMVIQDQTMKGRKSLTSFRTIVDWCDNVGFNLFECCIYNKNGKDGAWWKRRFRVDHEYIPIFMKGIKPKCFDKEPIKIPCKHAGKTLKGGKNRDRDGKTRGYKQFIVNPKKCPGTIWYYGNGGDKIYMKHQHPATFPDRIPYDLIRVFSKENDIVLDPMVGSGSTTIAASFTKRNYVGIDISEKYCELARERIDKQQSSLYPNFKNIQK